MTEYGLYDDRLVTMKRVHNELLRAMAEAGISVGYRAGQRGRKPGKSALVFFWFRRWAKKGLPDAAMPSDEQIAQECGVSRFSVMNVRRKMKLTRVIEKKENTMARGNTWTADQKKIIEECIRKDFLSDSYDDEECAKNILKDHHLDISKQGVRLIRTELGLLLRKARTKNGGVTKANLETPEGIIQAARNHIDQAALEITEAHDLMDSLEKMLLEMPRVTKDESEAIKLLRKKSPCR